MSSLALTHAFARLRIFKSRLQRWFFTRYWLPHVPLAAAVALGGFWLLKFDVGRNWQHYVDEILHGTLDMPPAVLPPILIGCGMLAMAAGLLLRSRLAWAMATLLVLTALANTLFTVQHNGEFLLHYFIAVGLALAVCIHQFDRSSIAAGTLFAFTSVALLIVYATFGAYYMGHQFRPPISDLVTALYYAMVTMTTVGYGDIIPQTPEAKLFVVSVIVLGVAIFATSLTAVIGPLVGNSVQSIVNRKGKRKMKREDHFIIVGDTALAVNTWRELAKRGKPVTRVLAKKPEGETDDVDVDIVVGDPSTLETLQKAGALHAQAVLAMLDDDSENAFVVLAVREIGSPARTIAAVNDARHMNRIKLAQPNVALAPQVLGGELTAMVLSGEKVSSDFVMTRVFQDMSPEKA